MGDLSVQVNFRLPKEDFDKLKKICETEDRTVSYVARKAVLKEIKTKLERED